MELPLKDQVINALQVLYTPGHPSELKLEANNFLLSFQDKVEAWSIADTLLRDFQQGNEVKLFMAQTLRIKIKRDLIDLDLNSQASLRDSLIQIIESHYQSPDHLLTQLSLSIALLAIQMKEWNNAVENLVKRWSSGNQNLRVLLTFLTVLPQECNSAFGFKTLSDRELRMQCDCLLQDNSEIVLKLLLHILQESGSDVKVCEKILECFLSWLKSGDISISNLQHSFLIDFVFNSLITNIQLFDIASEVICAIIYETRDFDSSMTVIKGINNKFPLLKKFLIEVEHDEDTLQGLIRIFSEAGEAYMDLIIRNPENFQVLLEAIVESLRKCPIQSLSTTFQFFYSFSQILASEKDLKNKELFDSFFEATLSAIINRLQFPKNDSDWSLEEMDGFKDFRHEIGNILKDCALVLGGDRALSVPYSLLSQQLKFPTHEIIDHWQEIEAVLFALRAMGSEIKTEDKVIHEVFNLLPNLPHHPKLRRTATLIISCYAEWTSHYPELLPFQLNYCSEGLSDKDIAPASTVSLFYLGKYCGKHLVPHLSALVELYKQYETSLEKQDLLELIGAIGFVIYHLPLDSYVNVFSQILNPFLVKLQSFTVDQPYASQHITELNFILDSVIKLIENGVISANKNSSPALPLIEQMWPILEKLLLTFHAHPQISELICSIYTRIIEFLAPNSLPYLPSLSEAILSSYKATEFSVYIWVVRKIFLAYYDNYKYETLDLLTKISELVFKSVSNCYHVDRIPQVVEEFSILIRYAISHVSFDIFVLPIFGALIHYYYVCLDMHEQHGLAATFSSFNKLLSCLLDKNPKKEESNYSEVVKHVSNYGEMIVVRLITNSLDYYSHYELHDACELIVSLAELNRDNILPWLQTAFLNTKNSPFSLPKDPNQPSVALRNFLDQVSERAHYGDFRKFRIKLLKFLKGYRRQQLDEEEERQVKFIQ